MAKKSTKTILVTGASGKQGGAVLRRLREKGFSVRALTRDPAKPQSRALFGQGTEVVRGDLEDPASLTRALDGVDGVFSVQSLEGGDVEAEVRQGINLVDAAKRFRLGLFVYSSVVSADKNTGIPHFESKFRIEERLRASGLQYAIFRPAFFMENWLGMRNDINRGTLAFPLSPETRLQMVAVDDIGAFVTRAFEHPGHWQGRAVELAGDELSMSEVASAFSRMAGSEVRYQQTPWDQFEKQAGPEMTIMFKWFENVGYHVDIPGLRQEYANLTGFERWLQANWAKAFTAS
jgi:uncharacterized protein YbjT (DUF2867 family)